MDKLSHVIASRTTSRVALEVALNTPELFESAVANPSLPEDIWAALLAAKKKPTVKVAKSLVDRPLSATMVDHLIATETRVNVLSAGLGWADPSLDQLTALLAGKSFTASFAEKLITDFSDVLTLDWLEQAAAKVGGAARTEFWLRAPDRVTDEEVNAFLEDYENWGPAWDTSRWQRLFATRPGVLAGGARSSSLRVRTAAAGCRHLIDPALQRELAGLNDPEAASADTAPNDWIDERAMVWTALVYNPTCDLDVVRDLQPFMQRCEEWNTREGPANRLARQPFRLDTPFEEVTDPVMRAWLIRRTVPNQNKPAGRSYDMGALLSNPHLSEGEVETIFRSLREHIDAVSDFREQLLPLAHKYPAVAAGTGLSVEEMTEKLARYDGPGLDDTEIRRGRLDQFVSDNAVRPPEPRAFADIEREHTVGRAPLSTLQAWYGSLDDVVSYLDAAVTPSADAWFVLFQLLGAGSFSGTSKDLAVVVNATAA